jgi:hypothetical protein
MFGRARGSRRASVLAPSVSVLILSLLACGGPARPHTALDSDLDPLRADFNRDIGHVRILTLVAPT